MLRKTCECIAKTAMQLNPVELVTPVNAKGVKKAFLKMYKCGALVEPSFVYSKTRLKRAEKLGLKLMRLQADFEAAPSLKLTWGDSRQERLVRDIINERIADAIATSKMASAMLVGDDNIVAGLSVEKYGVPSRRTLSAALEEAALGRSIKVESDLDVSAARVLSEMRFDAPDVAFYFEKALEAYGFEGWHVVVDRNATTVDVRGKNLRGKPTVVIPQMRKVDGVKLVELIGHEIECHLRASENSRRFWAEVLVDECQPLAPLLAKSDDELLYEGFAKQNDVRVRGSDALPTPNYVVAEYYALQGKTFGWTFETIVGLEMQHGASHKVALNEAWTATYLAYRGITDARNGAAHYAFTKDLAYYGGYHGLSETVQFDFSSMALRDVQRLMEAGFELEPYYEHKWLCLNPASIGLLR